MEPLSGTDPFAIFGELLDRARQTDLPEPTAMTLATADARGRPSARMVLLKGFDPSGFVFYTNLDSRKARELAENPYAALCFHWQPLEVQVRVEGIAQPVADEEADAYFASRSRGSQIGAWASLQSRPLPSRTELDRRIEQTAQRFASTDVSRPPFWSGYRVVPERIEFWYGRASRLHDRSAWLRDRDAAGGWRVEGLYP